RNLRHSFGLRQAQVHGDPETSLLILLQSAPDGYAAANWTEVKLESLAPNIRLRLTRDLDAFIFVVVRPEHAVAPACRAVAGGRTVRLPFKLPSHRATETGSLNHFSVAPPCLMATIPVTLGDHGKSHPHQVAPCARYIDWYGELIRTG